MPDWSISPDILSATPLATLVASIKASIADLRPTVHPSSLIQVHDGGIRPQGSILADV